MQAEVLRRFPVGSSVALNVGQKQHGKVLGAASNDKMAHVRFFDLVQKFADGTSPPCAPLSCDSPSSWCGRL
jgi:hypothetical protein